MLQLEYEIKQGSDNTENEEGALKSSQRFKNGLFLFHFRQTDGGKAQARDEPEDQNTDDL